ncbi:sensor domain-containing diguanylate cyclase [Paenibacillus paeoniae]|uniref:Diguanylate cyclase n=1 Tax=Paenibacillus paeoniae TaxID=2292705 RepID=A0A371PND4_9BACL|nr:sensor domain-containing diguanylate cyclase [Paenibacillus paeoniae]REK77691.1 diguanylate cyclase [Paenibacillus paeoniae]
MDIQLDTAPCGYFSISNTGLIQSVNGTLLNMLGYERGELLGKHLESTMSVTNKLFFHTYFYPYIQLHGHVNEMYVSFRTSTGQDVPVLLNGIRQQRDGETFIDCVVLAMRKRIEHEKDVLQTKAKLEELYQKTNEANQKLELLHAEYETKQQELLRINHQLEAMAWIDPLTGLGNRRFFQEKLLATLASYRENEELFSLFIMDIDHFKKINDTYGHPVGDLVLTNLARLLQSMSRENDIVARYGGEEFVAILPDTDQETAISIAERYCATAASTLLGEYQITISIGVATVSSGDTDQSLLHHADLALYASKSSGRNRATHAANLVKN